MATTVLISQNPEIVSKGTFTLNVRIKKALIAENEENTDEAKLSNNFLEGTDIPPKSNIEFSIKDENPKKMKKKINLIVKKKEVVDLLDLQSNTNTNEIYVDRPPYLDNLSFEDLSLNTVDIPSSLQEEIIPLLEKNNLVKKTRVMGHYFYVAVKSPYYIYCLETLDKIGLIKENREIDWYE